MDISNFKRKRVVFIDTQLELIKLGEKLKVLNEFAFDTEFDRFKLQYGFTLFLLQIFDGESFFLIDCIKLKDLRPIREAFENKNICKVFFSGSEDIELLKINKINPVNLFDIQIAATISGHSSKSLATLIKSVFNDEINKEMQTSDWRKRPLDFNQVCYACNDVYYLLELKKTLIPKLNEPRLNEILNAEHLYLEQKEIKNHKPKLSIIQEKLYSQHYQKKLLELIILRDSIAQKHNMPPYNIVNDIYLEEIIKDPIHFLKEPFKKGFWFGIRLNDEYKKAFIEVILSIDTSIKWKMEYNPKTNESNANASDKRNELKAQRYTPFASYIQSLFNPGAAEFILAGMKNKLIKDTIDWSEFKSYQKSLYEEYLNYIN